MKQEENIKNYEQAQHLPEDAFEREDQADDEEFYKTDRFVDHLDATALETVEKIIGTLVVEDHPALLDLMASWNSHLPGQGTDSWHVVGLGLNRAELTANPALSNYVIHDLNRDFSLPFEDETFDVVVNTVSVEYLVRPFKVFAEVARVLKPGGLVVVIFSNRMFPEKAIRLWREANEQERIWFVQDLVDSSGQFESTELYVSKGLPRPAEDRFADTGIPSDPIWAVYADKKDPNGQRKKRPKIEVLPSGRFSAEEVEARKKRVSETLRCPHCDDELVKWEVPINPFTEWASEHMYVCFNEECPFLMGSWEAMMSQGNPGFSYRLMYVPDLDVCTAAAIPPLQGHRPTLVHDRG